MNIIDDRRLKRAFAKIKEERDKIFFDLNALSHKLERHDKALTLNEDIKKQIEVLNRVNLEKFVAKLDKEIDQINAFIKDMDKRTEYVNNTMKNFTHQMEVQQVQFDDMKKKVTDAQKQAQTNKLDMKVLNDHSAELTELMNEKVSMENGALRLEMQTGFAESSVAVNKLSDKVDGLVAHQVDQKDAIPEIFEEFATVADKRIDSEINTLRKELNKRLDEIAKDMKSSVKALSKPVGAVPKSSIQQVKVSQRAPLKRSTTRKTTAKKSAPQKKASLLKIPTKAELGRDTVAKRRAHKKKVKKKAASRKTTATAKKATPQKKTAATKKDNGAFRRAVKWLFVDEDEETLNQVKKSVKE